MGTIGDWGAGATPLRANPKYYGGSVLWLKTGELNNGYVYDTEEKITDLALKECSLRLNKVGDILIAMYGATIGKLAIVGKELTTNQACCACTLYNEINNRYLFYYLFTSKDRLIDLGAGGAQPNISKEKLVKFLMPLPSLAEQQRIVEQIDLLFTLVDGIETQQSDLQSLTDNIQKRVLDLAIQGKLVPQDSTDESASVLLERIRKEKEALVRQGKIKRDKTDSFIYRSADNSYYQGNENIDDLLPFNIPDPWAWCRLGFLVDFSKNISVNPSEIGDEAWILDLEDIEKETGKLLIKKRMKNVVSKSDKHIFHVGNVLYSKLRPYLNKVIIADEDGYCTSEILAFDFGQINNEYAKIYLMSSFFVKYAMSDAYGVKMPRLGSDQGNTAFIPIPPLTEQKRIVEAINIFKSMIKSM